MKHRQINEPYKSRRVSMGVYFNIIPFWWEDLLICACAFGFIKNILRITFKTIR